MDNVKNFVNNVRSNWYVREPTYDSNVRVRPSREGYWLGAIAIAPFVISFGIGIFNGWGG